MPEISVHELAVIKESQTLDWISKHSGWLRETDESWMKLEHEADLCFNEGHIQAGQELATKAYELRVAAQRIRRELNRLYAELARYRTWLAGGVSQEGAGA